jgi:hypothetical protein
MLDVHLDTFLSKKSGVSPKINNFLKNSQLEQAKLSFI